jgi:hypothetical protein
MWSSSQEHDTQFKKPWIIRKTALLYSSNSNVKIGGEKNLSFEAHAFCGFLGS